MMDDRDAGKGWVAEQVDVAARLKQALEEDTAVWRQRPDVAPWAARVWCWARSELGLPSWVNLAAEQAITRVPHLFPAVKSK